MYGGYYGYGYYWDPTYFLVLVGLVLCLGASALVNSTMRKYSKVRNMRGLTGAEAARNILNREGLYNVQIECLNSDDGDHYDPRTDTVRLSYNNFNGTSVTAVSVAAHECGHAVQHATAYAFLNMRSKLVPIVSFASHWVQWVLLAGIILLQSFPQLMLFGIILFALTTLFSFVTLPVEINASARALAWLDRAGITNVSTHDKAKDALKWAAYTYVVAALSSLATLVYYILLFLGSRSDD